MKENFILGNDNRVVRISQGVLELVFGSKRFTDIADTWNCDYNFDFDFMYIVAFIFEFQVSLDSRVREIINRNMIAPSQHTFDEAQLQIYTLMHRDSYPRFVNSPTYKNMLRTVGVEPPESSASS